MWHLLSRCALLLTFIGLEGIGAAQITLCCELVFYTCLKKLLKSFEILFARLIAACVMVAIFPEYFPFMMAHIALVFAECRWIHDLVLADGDIVSWDGASRLTVEPPHIPNGVLVVWVRDWLVIHGRLYFRNRAHGPCCGCGVIQRVRRDVLKLKDGVRIRVKVKPTFVARGSMPLGRCRLVVAYANSYIARLSHSNGDFWLYNRPLVRDMYDDEPEGGPEGEPGDQQPGGQPDDAQPEEPDSQQPDSPQPEGVMLTEISEGFTCDICFEEDKRTAGIWHITESGVYHKACATCALTWSLQSNQCPFCRDPC